VATGSYIDASAFFLLDQACLILTKAFDAVPYLVGSAITKRDYRDVDVRMIMSDEEYLALFPDIDKVPGTANARYSVLCSALSLQLRQITGLPIDFQFQSMTIASAHKGERQPLGIFPIPYRPDEE
jgi:hypothetical protein